MMRVISKYLKYEEGLENLSEIEVVPTKKSIPITALQECKVKTAFDVYFNPKLRSTENMLRGTYLHKGLERIIKNHWEEIVSEVPRLRSINPDIEKPLEYSLNNGWKLIGRADMVLGSEIYEFKFKDTKHYDSFDKSPDDYGTKYAVEQLNAYLHMYDKATIGFIWVFNSDDFNNPGKDKSMKPKVVKKDRRLFEKTLQNANFVADIVSKLENKELPVEEIIAERNRLRDSKKEWMCSNCPYLAICNYIERTVNLCEGCP